MSWTDERIETLKRLWTEGHSASQIAGELGGVSRNAVIGKVHRLKLESRIKAPSAPATPAPAAAAPTAVPAAPAVVAQASQPAPTSIRSAPAAVAAAPQREAAAASAPRVLQPTASIASAQQPMARTMGATALKMEPELEPMPQQRVSAEVVPISRNLTLVQLSERTCKWPIGDPLSPDFRFCGNHSGEGSPYCQYHARIAFQPASERRRIR
ncbi:GcrA cell cycle regulator [Aureimonas altamirensis]|uniref:GcrA family cell cycle regulator n=1 Tax=Aureimonas altamirensis TaxID=370622 RepID=UPI001E43359C|nr:GcrA family cell cycle regulator [Aureimonas altamirensis]UHD47291.1 GcrA cell cycle regulator [Aureimonas altamirensis]